MSGVKTLARLSCLTKYIRLDAFFTTYSTWQFHLRSLLIIIPKTFTCLTSSSSLLLMDRGQQWVFVFAHCILISLHFFAFNFIQLLVLQVPIEVRLVWMLKKVFILRLSDKDTSSTYLHMPISGEEIFRLLIITRKRVGPSFAPWGTPAVTGSQSENEVDNFTRLFTVR